MRALNHLLVAATAVMTLSITQSVKAVEPVLSPRAAQLRHELRKVPSAPSDVDLAKDRPSGSAKTWAQARELRKVPSGELDIDLAHAPRPTLSPKDPRFEVVLRENAVQQFRIAPLK